MKTSAIFLVRLVDTGGMSCTEKTIAVLTLRGVLRGRRCAQSNRACDAPKCPIIRGICGEFGMETLMTFTRFYASETTHLVAFWSVEYSSTSLPYVRGSYI